MSTPQIWTVFEDNPFIHSSTLGGNPLSCAAGIETLKVLQEEEIPQQAARKGEYLLSALQGLAIQFAPLIKEVRGKGLLVGVEFFDSDVASLLAMEMAQRRVLVAYTLNNPKVIRLEPPLVITKEELDLVLEVFEASLKSVQGILEEIGG
jgi:putrescine aminotransferase